MGDAGSVAANGNITLDHLHHNACSTVSFLLESTLAISLEDFYMREVWVRFGASPSVYRFIDWSAVQSQMVELYVILSACSAVLQ